MNRVFRRPSAGNQPVTACIGHNADPNNHCSKLLSELLEEVYRTAWRMQKKSGKNRAKIGLSEVSCVTYFTKRTIR